MSFHDCISKCLHYCENRCCCCPSAFVTYQWPISGSPLTSWTERLLTEPDAVLLSSFQPGLFVMPAFSGYQERWKGKLEGEDVPLKSWLAFGTHSGEGFIHTRMGELMHTRAWRLLHSACVPLLLISLIFDSCLAASRVAELCYVTPNRTWGLIKLLHHENYSLFLTSLHPDISLWCLHLALAAARLSCGT